MLTLVKLDEQHMPQLIDMMDEWTASGEEIIPFAIQKVDYHEFAVYQPSLEVGEGHPELVPDSTWFCLDTNRDRFVGAVNIRHRLNEYLLLHGGHIGDGIRPSERGKGFATRMIALALEKCVELGLERVLMVCDQDNPASARTIVKNGGVLENEVMDEEGRWEQRYWIELTE
ncbi:MAG: GNAT family N-acetyltransferase [Flavonifractor sp.]|nr:GNAT family N-acetyltransferase [Flavonifractor sp.]